jgi:hypothetical protein
LDRHLGADPAQAGGQQTSHPVGPHDGPRHGLLDSATVAQQDDIRREDVEQALQIARFDRPLERLKRVPGRGRGNVTPWPARGDVRPGPVRDLADRGRALADGSGDLVVPEVGVSVSSTSSIAIETLSANSTSWATSGEVSSGSGSQGPT